MTNTRRWIRGTAKLCLATMLCIAPGFSQTAIRTDDNSAVLRAWDVKNPSKLDQSVRIDGGSISQEKFGFYWETRIEPAIPTVADGFSSRSTVSDGVIHRILLDRTGRTYFGYDVLIDMLPGADTYRITFQPLVMTPALARGFVMDAWSEWIPLAKPRFPAPQSIHGGEILELTLLTNSATGQRIVDYVSIQEPASKGAPYGTPQQRDFSYATGSSRDIAAADVEMRIEAPRVSINGILLQASAMHFDTAMGAFVWMYIPDHGRFILSLAPHPGMGFIKAGEVRGSTLEFQAGADKFAVSAGDRIAPGQSTFNLYVLHEPAFKPTYLFADLSAFTMGGSDEFESLPAK